MEELLLTMTSVLPPFVQACSGAIGSVVANASSYPLDLVCTRLQLSEKKGKHGKEPFDRDSFDNLSQE